MTASRDDEQPISGHGLSCVVCGGTQASWIHRVSTDSAAPQWTFCDICELMYLNNQDEALVEVMKHSGAWDWETDQDVELDIAEPLAALRRDDQGSRPLTH